MNYIKRVLHRVPVTSVNLLESAAQPIPIKRSEGSALSSVDAYWGEHTVTSLPYKTALESLDFLEWRSEQYPLFQQFMQLYGQHDNETILDYGCGPGNDLVGFLVHTKAKKVIGIDISAKALSLASKRLALHNIESDRIELIQLTDSTIILPIDDESVDYIFCEGVLHHVSNPIAILKEFHRILKPGSQAGIMVYNRNSLWFHLYTAYIKMVLQNAFSGLTPDQAFAKNTDGEACPISRCYVAEDFILGCKEAGFRAEFLGGYFALLELDLWREFGNQAQQDDRLADEHRDFLRSLVYDEKGYPLYKGKHAGIGGVYVLSKDEDEIDS